MAIPALAHARATDWTVQGVARAKAARPVHCPAMTKLDLAFIGTGNAWVQEGQCWNGFLVNDRYLFDTPPTVLMALQKMGTAINDIETIVISHHHGDHFLGLPFMLLYWKYFGRTKPVDIIGPPDTELIAHMLADRTYGHLFETKYALNWVVAKAGERIVSGDLVLDPVAMKHDPELTASLGFACTLDERRFAYTGDSAMCEGVLQLAREAEVLVAECSSHSRKSDVHMNFVDDMPVVRAAMRPGASLLLTHTEGAMDVSSLPNTVAAKDFEHYRF